jgi:hypothetical protein
MKKVLRQNIAQFFFVRPFHVATDVLGGQRVIGQNSRKNLKITHSWCIENLLK